MLYEKAESIDYRYDVQDQTVEGLLILPLYGSMPTGMNTTSTSFWILYSLFSNGYVKCVYHSVILIMKTRKQV